MDIKAEIAFQEAIEEVNDLSKRLILERSIRKQIEIERDELLRRNNELEGRLREIEEKMNQ